MIITIRRLLAVLVLLSPLAAHARPLYFENLTTIYAIQDSESIHACGVCHQRWEGTGARNPFGLAVESQLYLGKSIVDAILDIAGDDTDGDGFTNGDELGTYRTLPGYSCANFGLASNTPPEFQSIITPGVPTCLEPKDILVEPALISFITPVGNTTSATLEIRNNGSDFPLQVSSVSLLPGAPASYSIVAPATPFSIAVGDSVTVQVTFAPTTSGTQAATLRIVSDDPDEGNFDVAVSGLSFVSPLAPADVRAACLKDLSKQLEAVAKARLRAWGGCYLDELRGVACDTARRDKTVAKAEAKLRSLVGGDRARHCDPSTLSATLLGLPAQCGAPCQSIALSTIPKLADCAICQATAATDAMLTAAVGTTPPDLPANQLGATAWRCNRQLVTVVEKGIRSVQKSLDRCELDAVVAGAPANCPVDLASTLADQAARIDEQATRCTDTTGMLGCLFSPGADPGCLGSAATQIGTDLSETAFGPN
jgi:Abnormal spindle-like microcephaly-assoc'd, ASPM-SPD-2-Hydin